MQIPILAPRGLYRPPGTARVNLNHPASSKLMACWVFDTPTPWDLTNRATINPGISTVQPRVLQIDAGTPAAKAGPIGQYVAFSGSDAVTLPNSIYNSYFTGSITLVAVVLKTAATNTTTEYAKAQFAVCMVNGALCLGNQYGSPADVASGGDGPDFFINGTRQTASNRSDADVPLNKWQCYGTTHSSIGGTAAVTFGHQGSASYALVGGLAFVAVFQGYLPTAQLRALTLSPYDILTFPDDDLFSTLKGAAAVAPPTADDFMFHPVF